jgi:DNA excision repair protein ERCC-6-like 2
MVLTDSDDDDLDAPRIKREQSRIKAPIAKNSGRRLSDDTDHSSYAPSRSRASSAAVRSVPGHSRSTSRASSSAPNSDAYDSADEELKRIDLEWEESHAKTAPASIERESNPISRPKSKLKTRREATAQFLGSVEDELAPRSRAKKTKVTTGVGHLAPAKKRPRVREYEDEDDDQDLMEWTMPNYMRDRRSKFDSRLKKLQQGGLALPPIYDEVDFSDDEHLQDLLERPNFPLSGASRPYKAIELPNSLGVIPAPTAQFLRDYQIDGVKFLHELFVYQKGGILGDDMGLGKTVQVIAFLTAAYGKTGDERDKKRMRKMSRARQWYPKTLIICPGTLMENWKDEFKRWGWWFVDTYHGSAIQRHDVFLQAQAGMLEVMITTYHTYRANKDEINMIQWDCVVADECHIVKERKSETTIAMNDINALCRIGLTGTAIQNKYEELWTLLNWTNPGTLGPIATWKKTICVPLKLGQSHVATQFELAVARTTAKALVQNLLPQFFLRRTKALIKHQLPKKSDRVVFCPLTETQADAYQNFLDSDIGQLVKNATEFCDCSSGKKAGWCCHMALDDGRSWQSWVFPAIAALRNLSNHLAILIPQGTDPHDKQSQDLDMLQRCLPNHWEDIYSTRDSVMHTGNPEYCGKWRVLKKLLNFWHDQGDNKVLIFSHSVRLLKMLHDLFISTKFNVSYLDGTMAYDERYAAVNEFNTNPTQFVFLISTRAGGVGLNITSANKVVVVDPNWNPSYDLQAQDRAYRIGQTRDVEVFRLISQGTLEEIVYARQIYKQQQANIGYNATSERRYFQGVQGRQDLKGEIFGLQNLFAYQGENQVLRDIVNKTNIAESKADVRVANLDVDDEEDDVLDEDDASPRIKADPDSVISQLAAEIISDDKAPSRSRSKTPFGAGKETAKKHDPVQAILSSAGVSYTHENSEVIGSSKVEALLSKRAEQAATSKSRWGTQEQQAKVFEDDASQPMTRSDEDEDLYEHVYDNTFHQEQRKHQSDMLDGGVRYRYRPPQAVRKRQFCSMAKWAGYGEDVVTFALVVENWTQAERRECLDRFYQFRRDLIRGHVQEADPKNDGDNERRPETAVQERGLLEDSRDEIMKEEQDTKLEPPLIPKVKSPGSEAAGTDPMEIETESEDDEL